MPSLNNTFNAYASTDFSLLFTMFNLLSSANTVRAIQSFATGERNKVFDRDYELIVNWLSIDKKKEPSVLVVPSSTDYNSIVSTVAYYTKQSIPFVQMQYIIYQASFMPIKVKD